MSTKTIELKTYAQYFRLHRFQEIPQDWKDSVKKEQGLTLEYLNRKLGSKHRSFFSDLIAGRKPITTVTQEKLIQLIGLKNSQEKYFRALVGYGNPNTPNEKEFWFEQTIFLIVWGCKLMSLCRI